MPRTVRLVLPALILITACTICVAQAECVCEHARAGNGWCEACGVGYVAGLEIESHELWEALDAHGHEMDPAMLHCGVCEKAHEADGFCEEHRIGFVDGLAYYSRLTYELARGRVDDVNAISCGTCRKNAESHGWCETHRVGRVGHVAIEEREGFERASEAYHLLLDAIETGKRCEICAAMMILDGTCHTCKISYEGGKRVDPDPSSFATPSMRRHEH